MENSGFFGFLLGYCTLSMPREFCEVFLNLCHRYGFSYYDIKIDDENKKVFVNVPLHERKNILTACRVRKIKVKIEGNYGAPVWLGSLKNRWGIAIGVILSVSLFVLAQNVIWRVDVIGNERLDTARVISSLAENGLSVGAWIPSINADSVEQRVMIRNDDISWMSVNIIGTVARVEIRESIDTEYSEKNTRPANLVSNFDAQIVGTEIYTGFRCVKDGDFVRRGEILASGIYESTKAPIRYTRASGVVWGKVSHTVMVEIPLVQARKVPTGEKIVKKTLNFFGKSIKLFVNYRNLPISCDIINYVYIFNPFSLGELPISISVDEYYPYEMRDIEISEEEAIELAYGLLATKIVEELPDAQVLKKSIQGEIVDGKYVLTCHLTAICNIARQVEFEVLK